MLVGALPLGAWSSEMQQAANHQNSRNSNRLTVSYSSTHLTLLTKSLTHAGSQDSFLPAAFVGHRPQESKYFELGFGLLLVKACGMMTKSALCSLQTGNYHELLMKDTKTRCYRHCCQKLSGLSIFVFFLLVGSPSRDGRGAGICVGQMAQTRCGLPRAKVDPCIICTCVPICGTL